MKFGTSGIRGIYRDEIQVSDVLELSASITRFAENRRFVVGTDTRDSCKLIGYAVVAGLSENQSGIGMVGVAPTPVIAFATREGKYEFGVSCTASHNPPAFCGIKVFDSNGMAISTEIERHLENTLVAPSDKEKPVIIKEEYFGVEYMDRLIKEFGCTHRKFRILVDCANGAGSLYTPKILGLLGHDVISLNSHPSSFFPGRDPEPIKKNLNEVCDLVRKFNVDFGLVHDGDVDRLVLVNQDGELVPDYVFSYIMLKLVFEKRPGNIIISINSSNKLELLPKEKGFKAIRARLGKTFAELGKYEGVFATEPSKIVDPYWGLWEDGIYAAVMLTQYLSKSGLSLAELLSSIPYSVYLQENILVRDFKYDSLKIKVLDHFASRGIREVQEIDGLRVVFEDGSWVLFRRSGTEPRARIYVESNNVALSSSLLQESIEIYRAI